MRSCSFHNMPDLLKKTKTNPLCPLYVLFTFGRALVTNSKEWLQQSMTFLKKTCSNRMAATLIVRKASWPISRYRQVKWKVKQGSSDFSFGKHVGTFHSFIILYYHRTQLYNKIQVCLFIVFIYLLYLKSYIQCQGKCLQQLTTAQR